MIERAGHRIRVHLTGHLYPGQAREAAARLSELADEVSADTTPDQLARTTSVVLDALGGLNLYGADKATLARAVARHLADTGHRPPADTGPP